MKNKNVILTQEQFVLPLFEELKDVAITKIYATEFKPPPKKEDNRVFKEPLIAIDKPKRKRKAKKAKNE